MTISLINLVTQLRNGSISKLDYVNVVNSKSNQLILSILQSGGFICSYSISLNKILTVKLRYTNRKPVFNSLLLISKPGRRRYINSKELERLATPGSILFIGNSSGLTTINILKNSVLPKGGEPLFLIR